MLCSILLACLACRWDKCWIRLLDGMLQLSVAGTRDYELRIPTRIRSMVINNGAGTEDGQISVRRPCSRHIFDPCLSSSACCCIHGRGLSCLHCECCPAICIRFLHGYITEQGADGKQTSVPRSTVLSLASNAPGEHGPLHGLRQQRAGDYHRPGADCGATSPRSHDPQVSNPALSSVEKVTH